jgi:hypothetical protein
VISTSAWSVPIVEVPNTTVSLVSWTFTSSTPSTSVSSWAVRLVSWTFTSSTPSTSVSSWAVRVKSKVVSPPPVKVSVVPSKAMSVPETPAVIAATSASR